MRSSIQASIRTSNLPPNPCGKKSHELETTHTVMFFFPFLSSPFHSGGISLCLDLACVFLLLMQVVIDDLMTQIHSHTHTHTKTLILTRTTHLSSPSDYDHTHTHSYRRFKRGMASDSIAAQCQQLIAVVPIFLPPPTFFISSPASHVF